MNLEELSREELVAAVRSLVPGSDGSELEQMLHDLRVHQIELEMQNRQLRESQVALEHSRHEYAELYDGAPVAYCTLDDGGRIAQANLTASAFFGIERGALLGRVLSTLVVAEDRAIVRSHLKRCLTESGRVTNEVHIEVNGAAPVAFQMSSVAWKGTLGEVLGSKTTLTDISALKRAEERVRLLSAASADLAAADLGAALPALAERLAPTFADLCFIDVTEGAKTVRAAVAVASSAKRHLAEALKRGPIPAVELTEPLLLTDAAPAALALALPAGSDRAPIVKECDARSLMMLPMVIASRTLGLLGLVMAESGRRYTPTDLIFARDLANRVAMALENRRLHREWEAAARARQDVLSTVSHELKTPLTGALLNVDALLRTAPPEERRAGRSKVDHIRRSLLQMNHLVDDLLDLGSIDAGRLTLEKTDHALAALMAEAADLLAPQAEAKAVRFELDAPGDALWVSCDRSRLLQVFSNLLSNAVKFSPEGGSVKLQARREGDDARIIVSDDGPGLSPAVMRHLFERFSQAKETAPQGRGLGLFISKGIIEAHGGTIWVESVAKSGTRVHFTLPAVPKPPRASVPPPVVLVVEDDEQLRELTCELIVEAHFGVASVSNGREALDYLRLGGARPHLIVLDLAMPVMSGPELIAVLKADRELATIPIVLLSSSADLAEQARALGVAGSLTKPFDERALLKLAEQLGVKPAG